MADLRKRCTECGRQFRPQKGATHRKRCYTCAPPRASAGDLEAAPASDVAGPIEARALADLAAVDRHETVEGLLALSLARDIDADRVSPAQKGAAGQKLIALLAAAMEGTAPPTQDRLDELAERRAAREAS